MSTMSELSALLDQIKSCGNTLLSVADDLRELVDRKEPKATQNSEDTPDTTPDEQPKETPKPVTLEEVRAVLAEKSRAGHTAEVKQLITTYGADKLSEVDPANYAALLKDSEVIGNA